MDLSAASSRLRTRKTASWSPSRKWSKSSLPGINAWISGNSNLSRNCSTLTLSNSRKVFRQFTSLEDQRRAFLRFRICGAKSFAIPTVLQGQRSIHPRKGNQVDCLSDCERTGLHAQAWVFPSRSEARKYTDQQGRGGEDLWFRVG